MKKVVMMMMAAMVATAAMAQTQSNQRPEPKQMTPTMRTEMMVKQLNLDDSQALQLQKLNEEYSDVNAGPQRPPRMRQDNNSSSETRQQPPQLTDEQKQEMEKKMARQQEYETKLKTILNDTQFNNYKKLQPRGGKGGKRPQRQRTSETTNE